MDNFCIWVLAIDLFLGAAKMKVFKLFIGISAIYLLAGCLASTPLGTLAQGVMNTQVKTFGGVVLEMKSCQITPDRTATCTLQVVSNHRDRAIKLAGYVRFQDNTGVEYNAVQRGFGDPTGKLSRYQTMVADQPYTITAIATNLSTQATSIRAVILDRIDLNFVPRGFIGQFDQTIFPKPAMVTSQQPALQQSVPTTSNVVVPAPGSSRPVTPAIVSQPAPQTRANSPSPATTAPTPSVPADTVQSTPAPQPQSAVTSTYEVGFNRPFSDIGMLTLESEEPKLCQVECEKNDRCLAWTYVKPNVQGPTAVCWLKNAVPPLFPDANTVSGVMSRE